MPIRTTVTTAVVLIAALAVLPPEGAEDTGPREDYEILRAWVCPVHPESHHEGPGRCGVCGRPFENRALTYRWSCPLHHGETSGRSGACPQCGMDLVPTTVQIVWRCPHHEQVQANEPGTCRRDGAALQPELHPWAHGDHNPRHGGVLFMAPDGFHHVEGVLREGRFLLYVYDNYTRPLSPAGMSARIGDLRLRPTPDGAALAAPFALHGDTVEVVLHVDFGRGRENRFDFVFDHGAVPHQH